MRLLLVGTLLLASGVTPAIKHNHAAGNESHSHRVPVVHCHDDNCHHHHHHGDDVAPQGPAVVAGTSAAHLHFALLGFEITLPWTQGDSEQEGGSEKSMDLFVPMISDSAATASNDSASWSVSVVPGVVNVADGTHLQGCMARIATAPTGYIILCDIARHERSGVQLS